MEQTSLALIVCYFGKLPWYTPYFIHSARKNTSIDFLVITDDRSIIPFAGGNIQAVLTTLDEFSLRASECMQLPIKISFGYKLCDFKPAYGKIFADFLTPYTFWGHCDLDIILGDIRGFITEDLFSLYDLISVRPDWLTGCFLLYRNVFKVNHLYEQSRDYVKVFTTDHHYCFDETNFAHEDFSEGKSYLEINTEIESMMHVVKKMEAIDGLRVFFDLFIIEGLPGKLSWVNGQMIYKNKFEVLLYHLIYFKKVFIPKKIPDIIPDMFKITPTKLIH
ncbi:DUF6625 family protein [Mucilaginibacter gilvus]|uniref:Uncharacterized protein n=1 Tax=Mucilaginibacter gilvus TaxID=2305909 RepID=A0A3S4Y675_9SPHI|nr:DUF6625 family protein [Mucilaginibacter gilvus]RWY48330.1 hypothetical protein EPL05_19500 [Mucilaginibacter gilvus]